MYHFWRQNPLFRPALAFALGIVLFDYTGWHPYWLLPMAVLLSAQLFWQRFQVWSRVSLLIPSMFLLLGAGFHSRQPVRESMLPDEKVYLLELQSELVNKEQTSHCTALLLGYDSAGKVIKTKDQQVKILFRHDSQANPLLPGDRILAAGKFNKIEAPLNPHTFNYAALMARKGVFYQLGLKPGDWTYYEKHNNLKRFAVQCRNQALAIYDQRIGDAENKAIIKALICGYVQELVPDIRDVYVKSGTMHMLSVSGMHVGILLIILGRSIFWLKKPLLKNLLLILLLWTYALFTGLSPSVMRAVSMCTLYLAGESIHKKHSTWNAVAFALLVLLVWDTQFLFSAGFQLSFLALSGILLVSGRQAKVPLGVKDKIKNWFLSYLAISIAAQMATSPIAIFYFHQFPVYFLVGNLLIVPLAAPMMYAGLLLLLVSEVPLIAGYCAWVLNGLLDLCQFVAVKIAALPGAGLGEIQWDLLLVIALYVWIIGFVLAIKIQQTRGLIVGLILLICSLSHSIIKNSKLKNQQGLIVYSLYGKTGCDLYAGNQFMYIGDILDDRDIQHAVQPFRQAMALRHQVKSCESIYPWGSSILLDSLRILRLSHQANLKIPASGMPTLLILEKDANYLPHTHSDSVNFCNIVLAGNLNWSCRKSWLAARKSIQIPLHDLRNDGAFQIELWKYSPGMR